MSLRRFCRKRRALVKYIIVLVMGATLFSLWNAAINLKTDRWPKDLNGLLVDFDRPVGSLVKENDTGHIHKGAINERMCLKQGQFELANHADIYTYDLPDITDYTLISGKKFKEYTIPVKTEEVAHGPDLDPVTVLLIPFSHVDPGYGRTMEEYYSAQTKHTLDNMVLKLEQYDDLTFQWAETVFLERWWRDIKPDVKERVRKLIRTGQLEIVLGGWVMPDEASTHYISVIDQLIEGHQWLVENLETKPTNSWSNDPFGFSSTMPYFWKKTGIENMVILRIHQAIKGTLMKKKAMEFTWKQLWSDKKDNSILCHLMAYRGYWIGDTCGPYNQHICREYAFMHTEPVHKVVFVTKENLQERATVLYEQYRITAEIYRRHGHTEKKPGVRLFLPLFLGEDFSYTSAKDFDLIYKNYKLLFDYINSKVEWRMNVKFGTMKEYFDLIRSYQNLKSDVDGDEFASLAGDFFPYSDYQNDYWTGYYTTRPFNKQMSRELQHLIRMADIFHTYAFAYAKNENVEYESFKKVSMLLQEARRDLGMFLHHDGITGTSVFHVIQDFQARLFLSLTKTKNAIKQIVAQLLTSGRRSSAESFHDLSIRHGQQNLNKLVSLPRDAKGKIVVMNPSSRTRTEVVHILSSNPIKMLRSNDRSEINLQFDKTNEGYLGSFEAKVTPFAVQTYLFEGVSNQYVNDKSFGEMNERENGKYITIENSYMRADFDGETGMLANLFELDSDERNTEIHMEILAYRSARSGAYIFAPAGPAAPQHLGKPNITVVRGPLKSSVIVTYQGFSFTSTLYNTKSVQGKGLHINTLLDMKSLDHLNKEVILRFKSNIESSDTFFTDQNGFQFIGRRTYENRRIEENYYPLTTMMIIEDSYRRLILHSAQPHGAASLESGWMEVMLDRCVLHDDDKGLGQGVCDNVPTEAKFSLQVETFAQKVNQKEIRYTHPSTSSILMNDIVDRPLYLQYLIHSNTNEETSIWKPDFKPIQHTLPCSLEVVGLRSLVKNDMTYNSTSLILHQRARLCSHEDELFSCDHKLSQMTIETLFPGLKISNIRETSLSHLHTHRNLSSSEAILPLDMELRSFTVEF